MGVVEMLHFDFHIPDQSNVIRIAKHLLVSLCVMAGELVFQKCMQEFLNLILRQQNIVACKYVCVCVCARKRAHVTGDSEYLN